MSLQEIKEQALTLAIEEQAELVSFLPERLCRDDPAYREELTRRIDDQNPDKWIRWSDLKNNWMMVVNHVCLPITQSSWRLMRRSFSTPEAERT